MDSVFKMVKLICGEKASPMLRHMSQPGRQILTEAVRLLLAMSNQVGGNAVVVQFAEEYMPWRYEMAALSHDVMGLSKAIGRIPRNIKQADLLLSYLDLTALDKLEEMFPNQVVRNKGAATEFPDQFKSIYGFLTQEFLLDDFSATDLRRILELSRDCELRTVIRVAGTVQDLHKHTVPFLVSAVRHESAVGRAQGVAVDTLEQRSQKELHRLKEIFNAATTLPPSTTKYDPEWHRQLDQDIELDEEMRQVENQYKHRDADN